VLINARYLDQDALENYIAVVEGGLRESGSSRSKGSRGLGGAIGAGPAKIEGRKDSETESTLTLKDHPASRLQRLISAGHDDPENLAWIEVDQPEVDFRAAGTGAFIEWECDTYIPETIAAMSARNGLGSAVGAMKAMMPAAQALDLDTTGIPDPDQMDAMSTLLKQLDVAPVVIGEDSETEWKVVGSLRPQWIGPGADFEDRVRLIGKLKKRVESGRWYPMLLLPGMNLLPRAERRRQERQGPKDTSEEPLFLEGPLLVVDYLAILN